MSLPIVVLVALLAAGLCKEGGLDEQSPDIQNYRRLVALCNNAFVDIHNQKSSNAFTLKAYPKFLPYQDEELYQRFLGINRVHDLRDDAKHVLVESPKPTGPVLTAYFSPGREKRVNWTERGMVSPVKDQGFCGSCYAFAAIADIESSYLFRGKQLDLSEQQLIDCSRAFGNDGCDGGWMAHAFAYVMLKGVTSELRYPLTEDTAMQGVAGSCVQGRGQFRIKSYAYTSLRTYDCESLTSMVERRPVTAAVAINLYFFYYGEGVLENCGTDLNHAVFVTGFVESREENFWIVKNSWGTWWGMQGYAHINRALQYGNLCQICYAPSYSIL